MADFHQSSVTTIHDLRRQSDAERRAQLTEWTMDTPVSVLLPSLYSELERPALAHIVDELREATWIREIVIGLDRADESQFAAARDYFDALPQHFRIVWNDGPAMRELDAELADAGLSPGPGGKGRNVWNCLGYFLASDRGDVIAMHDCDIVTYEVSMLEKLVAPLVHPDLDLQVAKGFYSRTDAERLNGRVSRLLFAPLASALGSIFDDELVDEFADYLLSFRYGLAGEQAFTADVARGLSIPCDWGLEIGVLADVHRRLPSRQICQVDIADVYDHKHQDLSPTGGGGLEAMAGDIVAAVVRHLSRMGVDITPRDAHRLAARYRVTAEQRLDQYRADALLNGLSYDFDRELEAVGRFAAVVAGAAENGPAARVAPTWAEVDARIPDFLERLEKVVEADNA